jgi:hypothetical protein
MKTKAKLEEEEKTVKEKLAVFTEMRKILDLAQQFQDELLQRELHLFPQPPRELSEPSRELSEPPRKRKLSLSKFSGTPPNEPARSYRDGKVKLPADNVAALGRSLFTDYLVGVELAATLLLVATIGAIVIAGRRTGGLK